MRSHLFDTKESRDYHTKMKTTSRKKAPKDIFEAIALNDEESVKNFVEIERVSLKSLNSEKQTAAHVAAQNGHLKLLKYLLQKDSSNLKLVDHYGNNVLFWAVQKGSLVMVEYLLDVYELDISERNTLFLGNSAIHVAAENGQLKILRYFLEERHGDVNVRNDLGEPPIFSAADKTQLHTVKYFVEERNANVTMTDDSGDNILYVCAKRGELAVPKYLLDERKIEFNINHRDNYGCTVTFIAARFDNLDLVKYFVEEKHADINIADKNGRTPLYEAANIGHFEVVQYLVERGADLDTRDTARNKTVLQTTTDKDILKFLKRSMLKRTPRSVSELHPLSAMPCLWVQENCIETHESNTFDRITFFKLNAWLVIANACVSFFAGSRHKHNIDSSLMSLPDILWRRTDQFALEAVTSFQNGSSHYT